MPAKKQPAKKPSPPASENHPAPALAFEANIPIVLADDINGQTSWGIWASLYYTMPL